MFIKDELNILHFLYSRFLKQYWKMIGIVCIANTVAGFLVTLRPLVIAPALDTFLGKKTAPARNFKEITLNNLGSTMIDVLNLDNSNSMSIGIFVAIFFLLFSLILGGINFWSLVKTARIRINISHNLIISLHDHLLSLNLAFFHTRRSGDLLSRMNTDVTRICFYIEYFIKNVFLSLAQLLISLIILFRTDALFSIILIFLGLLHVLITKLTAEKIKKGAKFLVDMFGTYNANLLENLSGFRLIKSFAAEKFSSSKIALEAKKLANQELRFTIMRNIDQPIRLVADAFIIGIVLILIFYAINTERLTLQASLLFFYLTQQLLSPVSYLANTFLGFKNMIGGASTLISLFNTSNPVLDGSIMADKLKEKIVFKNIEFSYEKDFPVIKGFNLTINRGEMIAIVGPSGSGKSTLIDLVLRFYDVDKGAITFDGINICEFDQKSFRKNFGIVAQESLLFNGTIKENIIYNRLEEKEKLEYSIWAANAEEFIRKLPEGINTIVGEKGVRLSGGQKQRIAIARAIYDRPSILLLDEATSSLDSESEKSVQEAIYRVSKNITSIIIAHRLSTITHADKIVILNNGEIEAIGPHNIVYKKSPTYKRLYAIQCQASVL